MVLFKLFSFFGWQIFSLFLKLEGGRIGNLCMFCWRFCTFRSSSCWSSRSYVCFCLDYNIGSLPISDPLLSWCLVKFGREFFQTLLKLWPIIRYQLDQFLYESSLFVFLNGCIRPPCNRGITLSSRVGPYCFSSFQEGHFPLLFHLKYFLFFL